MLALIKSPYESPLNEVLNVSKTLWETRQQILLMTLWPFTISLIAAAISTFAPLTPPFDAISINVILVGLASQLLTMSAQALLLVRLFRFIFLDEGKGAITPPPFIFAMPEITFVGYRLLLLLPAPLLIGGILIGLPSFLGLILIIAWAICLWRFEFLFIDIALDRHVQLVHSWNQMGKAFPQYLLTLLTLFGVAIIPLFLGALFVILILSSLQVGFLGGAVMSAVQIAITTLSGLITARFYWRQAVRS